LIRILIADDHPLIRDGLKSLLAREIDFSVVAEATNGHEVLQAVAKLSIDIILLDITMPGKGGFDVMSELKKQKKDIPVLILTAHPERRYAPLAFKLGASGYVTKTSASTDLVDAIRTVISGKRYLSQALMQQLAQDFQRKSKGLLHEDLSDREFQVFVMIASGDSVHEIAKELNISEATAYTHRERIFQKMKVKSVAELTRYALEQGLLE
jgi:two-component system, NarL family, invasion response regulator UvrY